MPLSPLANSVGMNTSRAGSGTKKSAMLEQELKAIEKIK